jgi:uncharacterized protein (DUF427 family)
VRLALYYAAGMEVTQTATCRLRVGLLVVLSLGAAACRRPAAAEVKGQVGAGVASTPATPGGADAVACGAEKQAPSGVASRRVTPGPMQESIWDYPARPRIEPSPRHVQVMLGGVVIADSHRPLRMLERGHPPVFYIPPEDVRWPYFVTTTHATTCEYKGAAHYLHIRAGGRMAEEAAWSYPEPSPGYEAIRNYVAIYPGRVDRATVDDEIVRPERAAYFGGWVTRDLAEENP